MAELSISVNSHHFVVRKLSPRARGAVEGFARRYIEYKPGRTRDNRYTTSAVKVYAFSTKSRTEYRFHINVLDLFLEHLDRDYIRGHMLEITYNQPPAAVKVELPIKAKWQDREHQPPIIEYMATNEEQRAKLVSLRTGKGKAQPLDARIKVPGGWSTMGEMKVGREVIAKDGTTTTVEAVYPQGVKDIYRITFADGRSTECCLEHLWKVFKADSARKWRVITTAELMALSPEVRKRYYIDLIDAEDSEPIALPMAPYTLGVILGDGCSTVTSLTVTTPDDFVIDELTKELDESLELVKYTDITYGFSRKQKNVGRNSYVQLLKEMDLLGCRSYEKFVPEAYLCGSKEQRLSILQGLMDSDGTVNVSGSLSFSSTSLRLAKAVEYLVRSLGGIAHISRKHPTFTHKGVKKDGRLAYQVNIRHPRPSELFRLPRKKVLVNDDNQYSATLKLRIDKIEFVGRKEAQCISIAHPDRLYVTDEFVVTHNTYCALKAISKIGLRFLIVVKPKYVEKWIEDVHKTYDIDPEDLLVVRGSEQLMALLMLASNGELTAKCIIISNRTLLNWISFYKLHGDYTLEMGYDCTPETLCEHLGVGVRLIDEVHEDFHFNFVLDLHTNVYRSISLSATLTSYDPFLENMYSIAYPHAQRYEGPKFDNYVVSRAVFYRFRNLNKIRWKDPATKNYSHHVLESCILRDPETAMNYFRMHDALFKELYLKKDRPVKRCLIFATSIAMCTALTSYFKKKYPNLDVRRYVEDDPYENLMEADVSISTILSAGTGHDIADLVTVIRGTMLLSKQGNIQGFGRLRELFDGTAPEYAYLVCTDISKHMDYHVRTEELLKRDSAVYRTDTYHERI